MKAVRPDCLVVDFDDFNDANTGLRQLIRLKLDEPKFKATLFCIPSKTSDAMLDIVKRLDWLEPAVHGYHHGHKECSRWDEEYALSVLDKCEKRGFAKVFRAPHWEMNAVTYKALLDRDWVCADHPKNLELRPRGLKVYDFTSAPIRGVHGHIDYSENALENPKAMESYKSLHGEFLFISELFDTCSTCMDTGLVECSIGDDVFCFCVKGRELVEAERYLEDGARR